MPALASVVSLAFNQGKGKSCSSDTNTNYLLNKFKLFGSTGILTMAFTAIDMASWDLHCNALVQPLYRI